MNKDNYVTLPVAQRLVEKGIKVTVEAWWCHNRGGNWYLLEDPNSKKFDEVVPAPNMSELWRELPEEIPNKNGTFYFLKLEKQREMTEANYLSKQQRWMVPNNPMNPNPCDALAELLIWQKSKEQMK
jgi:hypothetical protein